MGNRIHTRANPGEKASVEVGFRESADADDDFLTFGMTLEQAKEFHRELGETIGYVEGQVNGGEE